MPLPINDTNSGRVTIKEFNITNELTISQIEDNQPR